MYGLLHLHNFTTETLDILTNRVWSNQVAINNMFLTHGVTIVHVNKMSYIALVVFGILFSVTSPTAAVFSMKSLRPNPLHKPVEPQVYPIMSYNGATVLSSDGIYSSKAVRSYGNILLRGIVVV